jgi:hypothetical protein
VRRLVAPLALAAILLPASSSAWSGPGHRIVAAIAEERLGPAARRIVREVVGDRPLSDPEIAMWADAQRDERTRAWHYVNIPRDAERYDAGRDCPGAGCAVAALERAIAGLRDGDDSLRLADSLRWLVHLVADLHQPMHAGEARDRGGNDTWVRLGKRRQPISVHRLWDAEVVEPFVQGGDPVRAARALASAARPADAAAWAGDLSPSSWATGSHLLARALAAELERFPRDGRYVLLPTGYVDSQRARTGELLSKAGVRLAALLDRIAAEREARLRRR